MVNVAIAGGTGRLGLTFAEHLKENPTHKVIVLSRKAPEVYDAKTPVSVVDYGDIEALIQILETNAIHTVISTIQVRSSESSEAEINLVKAASKSKQTRRFVSSNFSFHVPEERWVLPSLAPRAKTLDELRTTELEWTTINNGIIIDHIGFPHIKTYVGNLPIHIDMANRAAAIPGTGDDLVSFSYSFDIAKFVEAALDLPRWEEEMYCYSETMTYNELIRLIEQTTDTKFKVEYDSIEKLESGRITDLPGHAPAYSRIPKEVLQFTISRYGLYCVHGWANIAGNQSLNQTFRDIHTTTLREMVSGWRGKY